MLGTQPRSSARAVRAINGWFIFPALVIFSREEIHIQISLSKILFQHFVFIAHQVPRWLEPPGCSLLQSGSGHTIFLCHFLCFSVPCVSCQLRFIQTLCQTLFQRMLLYLSLSPTTLHLADASPCHPFFVLLAAANGERPDT